jgi:cell division protein FtsQ
MNRFDYNQPNTRERIAARRKTRRGPPGSQVKPGPRRAVGSWVASGRVASLLLLIAALGALVYVFSAPRFTVRDIRVQGAQAMSADAVVALADARGQSIWLVDTSQIIARLKTSAYIEQASVAIGLPDQMTINVGERRPEVRWKLGSTLYLVDASGLVLDSTTTAPLTDTLVIEDRSKRPLQPNDRVDPDALKLGQMLSLRLPAELGLTPATIGWDIGTGIFATTADGRMIIFGQTDNLDSKFAILGMLLKDQTPFTYLDLRPNTPFYRNDATTTPVSTAATATPE